MLLAVPFLDPVELPSREPLPGWNARCFHSEQPGRRTRSWAPSAAIVPANTAHSTRALTASRAIVVDHPVRAEVGGVST
jgi:hypothetical protein